MKENYKRQKGRHPAKSGILLGGLLLSVVILFILGLVIGSVDLSLRDVFAVLFGKDTVSKSAAIIRSVRLPRVIGGLLAGAGLGTAGVLLQGVMNNALASPNTIGVNSGAGFFVMLSMLILPHGLFTRSVFAFLGALLTALLILGLAYVAEKSRITIILAGVTISSILSAGMNVIRLLDSDVTVNATQFLIGSLAGLTLDDVKYPAIGIILAITLAMIFSKALDILALGDGVACSLGLNVNAYRVFFVILASVLAGLVVSFAGLVGFVGLIVPHICRALFGSEARIMLPAAALLGGDFMLFSDLMGRTMFAPYELPVGIILSIAGGSFFLYLIMRKGGRRISA